MGRNGSAIARSPAMRGDDDAVLLGEQDVAGERALGVHAGEVLERGAVRAAGGPDDDGWIDDGVLGMWGAPGSWGEITVCGDAGHQHK